MVRSHGGREAEFHLDDSAGSLKDLSSFVDNVDAPSNIDTAEVTGLNEARKSYIVGQIDTPVSISGSYDDTATTGAHTVLAGLIGGTTGFTMQFYPRGSASGSPSLVGEVLMAGYQISAPVAGKVSFTASFVPFDATGIVWGTV